MTGEAPKPRPPAGLGPAGKALWRRLTADYVFGTAEVPILAAAARQLDVVTALEAVVEADGVLTTGSKGQVAVHPAVAEARLGRITVARLLGSLAIPDDANRPTSAASLQARKAADSRWARKRAERERREAALSRGDA